MLRHKNFSRLHATLWWFLLYFYIISSYVNVNKNHAKKTGIQQRDRIWDDVKKNPSPKSVNSRSCDGYSNTINMLSYFSEWLWCRRWRQTLGKSLLTCAKNMAKIEFEAAPSLEKNCEVLEGLSNIDSMWNCSKRSVFDHCQSRHQSKNKNKRTAPYRRRLLVFAIGTKCLLPHFYLGRSYLVLQPKYDVFDEPGYNWRLLFTTPNMIVVYHILVVTHVTVFFTVEQYLSISDACLEAPEPISVLSCWDLPWLPMFFQSDPLITSYHYI